MSLMVICESSQVSEYFWQYSAGNFALQIGGAISMTQYWDILIVQCFNNKNNLKGQPECAFLFVFYCITNVPECEVILADIQNKMTGKKSDWDIPANYTNKNAYWWRLTKSIPTVTTMTKILKSIRLDHEKLLLCFKTFNMHYLILLACLACYIWHSLYLQTFCSSSVHIDYF